MGITSLGCRSTFPAWFQTPLGAWDDSQHDGRSTTAPIVFDHSAQYVQLDGTLRRLLDCFWQDEPVPVAVGEEIRRVDALREEVRREIVGLEERIEELQGKVLDEAALGESLSVFGEGFEKLDQEEQKRLVQAVVGAVAVNILEPQGEGRIPEEQAGGLGIRTKRVLLNIRLKGKTPEQGCSGASQGDRVNQTVIGSDLEQIGSAGRRRIRTCAIVDAWGDLDSRRNAAEFILHYGKPLASSNSAPVLPANPPRESPEQRALRFQQMLASEGIRTRAELARKLGVARSYVTQVLRHLPAAALP